MKNRARWLVLPLTVPLTAVTAVLVYRAWQYPALGLGGVLVLLLMALLYDTRNRITGRDPDPSARPDTGSAGCLTAVFLAFAVPLVLIVDRPWNSPWWPGRHESSSLPDPCDVGADAAASLVPGGVPAARTDDDAGYGATADCVWNGPEGQRLRLSYHLVRWQGSLGGPATEEAREVFADDLGLRPGRPWPGVGDEAARSVTESSVDLLARKANVIVRVTYNNASTGVRGRTPTVEHLLRTGLEHVRTD